MSQRTRKSARPLRLRLFFVSVILLSASVPSVSLAQFPYEAVTTAKVNVRSGPSENYYTTARLDPDSHVMVVREEPGGWLAIEPPDESFSWIAGEYVREITATEGEVTANDVLVRIGTPFDPRKKDASQKKLNRGARVMILEKTTSGEGSLTKVHYKIVPPAGEVRFVSAQYVQPVSGRRPSPRGGTNSGSPETRPPARDLGTDAAIPSTQAQRSDATEESDEDHDAAEPKGTTRGPRTPLERANAAYLSMMKKTLPDRDLGSVRALYEQAAQSVKTDSEHALIADRLEALQVQEERQAKFVEFDRAVRRSKQRDDALLSIPRRKNRDEPDEADESQTQASPRYDASGTLRRSTAVIDGKPAYVLLSPQGGIRYYVSPSPGVDLTKYLDKVVAVRGPSSYRLEIRAQHITVRDITVIELNQSGYRDAKSERGMRRS